MAQDDDWFNDDDFGGDDGWGEMGQPAQQHHPPAPQQPAQPVYRQQPPAPVQTKRAKPKRSRPQRPRPAPRPPRQQPGVGADGFVAFDAPAPAQNANFGGGRQQHPHQNQPNAQQRGPPQPTHPPAANQPAPDAFQQAPNAFEFNGMDQQAMAQMGMDAATRFMTGNLNADDIATKLQAQFNAQSWFSFEYYKKWFKVDTRYVLKKTRLVCFPIWHDFWARRWDPNKGYLAPKEDINSPDAYVPVMAYLTYVLVIGYVVGYSDEEFSPEVMFSSATAALVLLFLESVVLLKFGFHLTGVLPNPPPPHYLDLLSYSGYKFLAVNMSLAAFLLSESTLVYYVVAGISALCVGAFMFRSFVPYYGDPMDPSRLSPSAKGGMFSVMNIFLLIVCVLQIPQVLFLSWAGSVSTPTPELVKAAQPDVADTAPPE